MKHALIIVNPAAGNHSANAILPAIKSCLAEHGFVSQHLLTSQSHEFHISLAKAIKTQAVDLLLIVGGDGTANLVLNALPHFNICVGLLQVGSGNDFGRALHFPKNWRDQLKNILHCKKALTIDLWTCNNRLFLNGTGLGFDGKVAHEVLKLRKARKNHKWRYWLVILKELFSYRSQIFTISSEKGNSSQSTFLLTAGNGVAFGGGFYLTPKASLHDQLLDICCIKGVNVLQRIMRMPFIPLGKHTNMQVVHYSQTATLKVTCTETVWAHIDGEPFQDKAFTFSISPHKLRLLC